MTLVGSRTQTGIKETGRSCSVPNNDRARLMYYLNCMCSVLDLTGESGLNKLGDYEYYWTLYDNDEKALIALCLSLNPTELDDKCISVMPEGIPELDNRFLELSSTETNFKASSSVLIRGQRQRVSKVMLCKASWMKNNYLQPMQNITNRLSQEATAERRRREEAARRVKRNSGCTIS